MKVGLRLMEQAKVLTDEAYHSIVTPYKETIPILEQGLSDITTSIRNDLDMAIMSRINKQKRTKTSDYLQQRCLRWIKASILYHKEQLVDSNAFVTNLRRSNCSPPVQTITNKKSPFITSQKCTTHPTSYLPPLTEGILDEIREDFHHLPSHRVQPNLSKSERKALTDLKNNKNIVILGIRAVRLLYRTGGTILKAIKAIFKTLYLRTTRRSPNPAPHQTNQLPP